MRATAWPINLNKLGYLKAFKRTIPAMFENNNVLRSLIQLKDLIYTLILNRHYNNNRKYSNKRKFMEPSSTQPVFNTSESSRKVADPQARRKPSLPMWESTKELISASTQKHTPSERAIQAISGILLALTDVAFCIPLAVIGASMYACWHIEYFLTDQQPPGPPDFVFEAIKDGFLISANLIHESSLNPKEFKIKKEIELINDLTGNVENFSKNHIKPEIEQRYRGDKRPIALALAKQRYQNIIKDMTKAEIEKFNSKISPEIWGSK